MYIYIYIYLLYYICIYIYVQIYMYDIYIYHIHSLLHWRQRKSFLAAACVRIPQDSHTVPATPHGALAVKVAHPTARKWVTKPQLFNESYGKP